MPVLQDSRTRVARTGALLVLVSTLTIAPTAVHAQRTPAPTGLEVTGTSAAATVTWQPVKGALTYSVKRWKQDDLKCCNNSVADLTTTAWIDSGPTLEGFPPPGTYVFEVTAQRGRTSGAAVINWTLPAAKAPRLIAAAPVSLAAAPPPAGTVAVKALRGSPPTGILTANTPLAGPAPQNVHVLPGGPTIHTLVWDPVPGISGYSVFRNNAATGGEWMLANGTALLAATFPDTNILHPGAKYRVTALYPDGRQGSTDFLYSDPPQPQVPTGFAAQEVAPGKVRLSWQPVAFATGYRVIGVGQPPDGALVNATELVLSGLADGAHSWKLTADYGGVYQTAGMPTAGITLAPPPAAPTGVVVTGTPLVAKLAWNAMPNAQRYIVRRSEGTTIPVERTPAGYTSTQFEDTVPNPSATYRYTVEARYANGTTGQATAVPFTPPKMTNPTNLQGVATAPTYLALYVPPPRPNTPGRIMQDIPGKVSLSWTPVAGATFYKVRWGGELETVSDRQVMLTIPNNGSYTFSVVAYFRNEATQTNYSDETTPARVTLQVGPVDAPWLVPELYPGQEYLRLHWNEAAGVNIREVWRVTEGEGVWTMPDEALGPGWAEARGTAYYPLTFGKSYRYRVILATSDGRVLLSNQARVTIPPNVQLTFEVTSPEKDIALLRWNAMPGATSYVVWWKRWDPAKLKYFNEPLTEVPATQLEYRHPYYGPAPAQYTLRVLYADPNVAPVTKDGSVVVKTH